MIGYIEGDNYYFLPNNTFALVVQFYKQQNVTFALKKTPLFKQMANEGLIEVEITGGVRYYSKQKRFGNEKNRYLVIQRKTIDGCE